MELEENKIHTSLNSYCIICGKINDKMKNSIVIDYMQKVDTPMGKRYIQISEDVLYDTYHGRLPVFYVEDIYSQKGSPWSQIVYDVYHTIGGCYWNNQKIWLSGKCCRWGCRGTWNQQRRGGVHIWYVWSGIVFCFETSDNKDNVRR